MGTLKTTNIQSISGSGTVTLGVSGETFDIPSGVTLDSTGATITGALANTPSFAAVVSTDTSLGTSKTLVPFDVELYDSASCYTNTAGNYKFTPNVAGKYYIGTNLYGYGLSDQNQVFYYIDFNGTTAAYNAGWVSSGSSNRAIGSYVGAVLEFDGVDDYVQVYIESGSNAFTIDNGNYAATSVYTKQLSASHFFGYRIIGA